MHLYTFPSNYSSSSCKWMVNYQWKIHLHPPDLSQADTHQVLPSGRWVISGKYICIHLQTFPNQTLIKFFQVDGELSVENTSACTSKPSTSRRWSSSSSEWWVISGRTFAPCRLHIPHQTLIDYSQWWWAISGMYICALQTISHQTLI